MRSRRVDTPTDFEILDPGDGRYQIVRFSGNFQGRPVIWTAHIFAQGKGQGAYIDIDKIDGGVGEVKIGLPIECIDTPAINKSIIMIRQYKNLIVGRHEFGVKTQD